jgi:hypothetical protein
MLQESSTYYFFHFATLFQHLMLIFIFHFFIDANSVICYESFMEKKEN